MSSPRLPNALQAETEGVREAIARLRNGLRSVRASVPLYADSRSAEDDLRHALDMMEFGVRMVEKYMGPHDARSSFDRGDGLAPRRVGKP